MPGTPFGYEDPYTGMGMDEGMPTEPLYPALDRIRERERPLTPEEDEERRRAEMSRMQRFGQVFSPGLTGNAGQSPAQSMQTPQAQPNPYAGLGQGFGGGFQTGQQVGQVARGLVDLFGGR